MTPRAASLVTLAVGALAALVVRTIDSGAAWADLAPGDCAEYCEASTRCGPPATRAAVQQPVNAFSNLAYLFVGLLALRRGSPTHALFAASCVVLAVGSFAFHATTTRAAQHLDMVGTYGVVVALAARGAARAWAVDARRAVAVALVVDAAIAVFKWRLDARVVLPLLCVAAAAPLARVAGPRALVPLVLLVVAFACRQLDVARVWCDPDSALQGHAAWHVLTAAALGVGFAQLDDARNDDAPASVPGRPRRRRAPFRAPRR